MNIINVHGEKVKIILAEFYRDFSQYREESEANIFN